MMIGYFNMEEFKTLPEDTRAELIDNIVYDSPSPAYGHQTISKTLLRKLMEHIEDSGKGMVFHAPYDVYLDEMANAVQPDLIIVLNDNLKTIDTKGHIHGVPDILIEILSPGNKNHDRVRKKKLYERFGVKEYWIIDPETRLASGYGLSNKKYRLVAKDTGMIRSGLLQMSFDF